jgi:hypothetical protein
MTQTAEKTEERSLMHTKKASHTRTTTQSDSLSPTPTISAPDIDWKREKREEMWNLEEECKVDTGMRRWWEPWMSMWDTISSYKETWEALCPGIWRRSEVLLDMFMRKWNLPAKCLILIIEDTSATRQNCPGGMESLD